MAATPQQIALGLGERDALAQDRGMLFVYPVPTIPTIWMKGMRFPIDILWVSSEGRLLGVVHSAQPEPGKVPGELTLYPAPGPVSYVLEINAGLAEQYAFAPGDAVEVVGVEVDGVL